MEFPAPMGLLDFLDRRVRRAAPSGTGLLPRLLARVPSDGVPGLLPPGDEGAAEAERRLGERFAAELHAYGAHEPPGLGRRVGAVIAAARRRRVDELEEAVEGLGPWELPSFLEALDARTDLPRPALVETARRLAGSTGSWEVLGAALALIGVAPAEEDRALLLGAGRSTALTGICAMSLEPLGPGALLSLAAVSEGLGRALALERLGLACAENPGALAPLAPEALRLAAGIADPAARAYAAVPLLEVADAAGLLLMEPGLAEAVAACVEATARGGWNGGPGPGLGRLPGAMKAAEAVLGSEVAPEVRLRAARAVLEAHPMPAGPVRQLAQAAVDAAG